MDRPPHVRDRPGDRLLFYVEEWRHPESATRGAGLGWCEVYACPAHVCPPHGGYHWYWRSYDWGVWIAFRVPGDGMSHDARVTAWRVECQ